MNKIMKCMMIQVLEVVSAVLKKDEKEIAEQVHINTNNLFFETGAFLVTLTPTLTLQYWMVTKNLLPMKNFNNCCTKSKSSISN